MVTSKNSQLLQDRHWKRLEGPELEGPEHFEKKYQNVPGAAGPAAGAAAASIYSKITKKIQTAARSAPLQLRNKCVQQKQQQKQQQLQKRQHLCPFHSDFVMF